VIEINVLAKSGIKNNAVKRIHLKSALSDLIFLVNTASKKVNVRISKPILNTGGMIGLDVEIAMIPFSDEVKCLSNR
jgi:hypothetical protein